MLLLSFKELNNEIYVKCDNNFFFVAFCSLESSQPQKKDFSFFSFMSREPSESGKGSRRKICFLVTFFFFFRRKKNTFSSLSVHSLFSSSELFVIRLVVA